MKMNIFKNNNNLENNKEDKLKNDDIFNSEKVYVSMPFKTKFKKPLYNYSTFNKDIEILDKYATNFYSFFMENNSSRLPMFTFPPEPKSVKRVTVDKTFTIQANQSTFIQIFPFSKNMMFSQDGTNYDFLLTNDQLNCFVKYKVVCCKIMIKQIGIMHLSDGYGTAFDAIMTTSSSSFNYLKQNLLGVQTAPGRKAMLVDGRSGLQALILGSPLYHYNYNYSSIYTPDILCKTTAEREPDGVDVCIPSNSVISMIGNNSNPLITFEDGSTMVPPFEPTCMAQKIIHIAKCGILAELPQGDSIFIRISPPTINVSIKLYIDLVVEGQVKDEFLSNMPQYVPSTPFDFNRIIFAFNNVVPAIIPLETISSCKIKGEKTFIYPNKPVKRGDFPGKRLLISKELKTDHCMEIKIIRNKKIEKREKKRRRILKRRQEEKTYADFLLSVKLNEIRIVNTTDSMLAKDVLILKETRERFDLQTSWSLVKKERFDSCDGKRRLREKERICCNLISYCSIKNKKVNRLTTIQKFSSLLNPIELPDYIKEACIYTGEVVTMLRSTANSNRLFRDSFTPLPNTSYQYFPAITNEGEVYPALVVVKLGITEKQKIVYNVPIAEGGGDAELTVSYDSEQFTSEEEFVSTLDTVINYAYGKLYHYCPPEGFSIKFFGKGKFSDISYMYALTNAIFGSPSGGFYSGAFTEKEGVFTPVEMDKETIQKKVKLATPDFPLNILSSNLDNGTTINTISGGIPSYEEGKLMPSSEVSTAIIYSMTPFSIRGYKKTPLFDKTTDAKRFLTEKMSEPPIKYIIFSNVDSMQKYENLSKEIPYKYFSRANPDNFTCYAFKNGRISDATTFYETYPDLLDEGVKFWKFEYNNQLYVERNAFLSDLRRMKYKGTIKGDKNNIKKYQGENRKILNINEDDVDKLKDDVWERISKQGVKANKKINIDEISKENLARNLTSQDYDKLDEYKDLIIDGLTALVTLLEKNPPTSKSSKPVSETPEIKSLLGVLKMPLNVSSKAEVSSSPEWKYFKKLVDELGAGGLIAAANIFGWLDNPQVQYKTSTLSKLLAGLKSLSRSKMPRLPEDEEDEKTEKIKESANKRVNMIKKNVKKRSNVGAERSEQIQSDEEKEEQKEEVSPTKPKKSKKAEKEVYDYFENDYN